MGFKEDIIGVEKSTEGFVDVDYRQLLKENYDLRSREESMEATQVYMNDESRRLMRSLDS